MNSDSVTISLGDVTFRLKESYPFEWLCELGKVFCVFDQQDSGNIAFGIEKKGKKQFVKFAGAKTLEYNGDPLDAIQRLKEAMPLYEQLSHPKLIQLNKHYYIETGYVAVFDWFDGECLHSHWSFPPLAKYSHPDSPFFRFKQLPLHHRLRTLDDIFSFHVHVEANHYAAVDFYDGSILYNFENNTTKICDIDYYQAKPFVNNMGRMWGSSRFMSPEEFQFGAPIDSVTNVFNMGAMAFCLLGGELDHDNAKWDAGSDLYKVAYKAVEKDRNQRYSSVAEFYTAWRNAI